jgi:hypothetical protein
MAETLFCRFSDENDRRHLRWTKLHSEPKIKRVRLAAIERPFIISSLFARKLCGPSSSKQTFGVQPKL